MNSLKNTFKFLNIYSNRLLALSFVGFILPPLLLIGFGTYAIFAHGYGIYFAAVLLLSSLLIGIPRWLLVRKNKAAKNQIAEQQLVEPSPDWSQAERLIWDNLNVSITKKLQHNDDWGALKDHALALTLEVAQAYGKKELDFTVPEGLQMLEEISRRYRKALNEHAPAIDRISLSQAKTLYSIHDKYGATAQEIAKYALLAWRAARMSNPATGLASELRDKFLGSMSEQAFANIQHTVKRALLQEVVSVSLDLYSGRFVIEPSQVGSSATQQQDEAKLAAPPEPVRVCLVGQVSAGKSSLVNALIKNMHAEVDTLPATHTVAVYPCFIEGEEQLRLIDMAGLDGSDATLQSALKEITQSDLVLWVLKANQPSRQLDVALQEKVQAFYARKENISRKKPPIIGVLNQVDLLKPINEWAPPYELSDTNNAKVNTINEALAYNRHILGIEQMYPLALPTGKPTYGLETLENEIQQQFEHAVNVQLNRRRIDSKPSKGLTVEVKRLFNLSKKVPKSVV